MGHLACGGTEEAEVAVRDVRSVVQNARIRKQRGARYKAGSDLWKLGERFGRTEVWGNKGVELRRSQESHEAKPASLANAVDNNGSR